MKQNLRLLFIALFSCAFIGLQAQSIAITDSLGNSIVGDTIFASGPAAYTYPGFHISVGEHVIVKNTAPLNMNVKVKRYVLYAPPPTKNQFCWGVTCYPITTGVSTQSQQISPGGADSSFIGYFFPDNQAGIYYIRYVFFVDGNPGDSSYFDAQIKAETQGIENNTDNAFKLISAYPNPASNYVIFEYQNKSHQNIKVNIFDMVGNRVKSAVLENGKSKLRVNLSSLNSGVYFYAITGNSGKILLTKRLIITN